MRCASRTASARDRCRRASHITSRSARISSSWRSGSRTISPRTSPADRSRAISARTSPSTGRVSATRSDGLQYVIPLGDGAFGEGRFGGRSLRPSFFVARPGAVPQGPDDPEGGRRMIRPIGSLVVLAAIAALPLFAAAQVKAGATAADVAIYAAPDRMQKIMQARKKEGELNIYTSAQQDDMGALVNAFEKKYGIKVNIWRASSEKVLQRAVQEARGNRNTMDIAETNGPELESMHREKILTVVKSPHLADLIAPAIRPHGEWLGTRLHVFVQAYNTKLVKKEELPKTWEDLANPKWKGKLGIEQEDSDWLAGEFAELGEAKAMKVFKDIVDKNGVSVRKGHTLLAQLVVSGEIPMALTVYNYKAEQLKNKGAPIDWFSIGPAIPRPNGVGGLKKAPHPHAAVLFYEFESSPEGQKILAGRHLVPTSKKVDTPLNKIPMKFVDARVQLDEFQKWEKLYADLFTKGAK